MKRIYCISGLGADERIFQRLQIPGVDMQYLQWITPFPNEDIGQYAKRMSVQVADENAILMGVSFGGMMAVEIAKHISTEKIILISSIKSRKELPRWLKLTGRYKLNRLAPAKPWKWLRPFENNFLGAKGIEEKKLANDFREKIDPGYLRWAIEQVVNWQNESEFPGIYHIHGSRDKTFPIKYIKPTHVIKKGGHFMIMSRAEEVSSIIGSILLI
jgi:pimeloyl-ACP methyl ester carboxylesterase